MTIKEESLFGPYSIKVGFNSMEVWEPKEDGTEICAISKLGNVGEAMKYIMGRRMADTDKVVNLTEYLELLDAYQEKLKQFMKKNNE